VLEYITSLLKGLKYANVSGILRRYLCRCIVDILDASVSTYVYMFYNVLLGVQSSELLIRI
jgi:hypothetical protein